MLAVTTTAGLTTIAPQMLKRAPPSVPPSHHLPARPTATAWSTGNTALFLASHQTVLRYDPTTNTLADVHTAPGADPISCLVVRDKATLVYSAAHRVHVLEPTAGRLAQTFDAHKAPVAALSLSNDASLLAATSAAAAHVHNLALGAHTVLRGTPAGARLGACAFHPHLRTRLLVGAGAALLVYDTTRPSAPLKSVPLGDAAAGEIVGIACSPFSKTLVAVAMRGGTIALVDLDKEKGLFRTLNAKVPLTAIDFSPEGAAIYLGTENGKLLIMDLRSLDKPPKTIVISEDGDRVETISVQKKIKGAVEPVATSTTTTTKAPMPVRKASSTTAVRTTATAPSPGKARVRASSANPPVPSPARRTVAKPSDKPVEPKKKVFSPVRDPHGNSGSGDISVEIEALATLRGGLKKAAAAASAEKTAAPPARPRPLPLASPRPAAAASTRSSASARSRAPASPGAGSGQRTLSAARAGAAEVEADAGTAGLAVLPRRRTASSASRAGAEGAAAVASASSASRAGAEGAAAVASASAGRAASRAGTESASAVSRVGTDSASGRAVSRSSAVSRTSAVSRASAASRASVRSRTPSPDLPGIAEPVTPVPARAPRVVPLGTVEVDRWIAAGAGSPRAEKGKGKVVGFEAGSDEGDDDDADNAEDDDVDEAEEAATAAEAEAARERSLVMQVSPRRVAPAAWAASPARGVPPSPAGAGGGGPAHDLLRALVRDALLDFQRETRAEMTGLHLDLIRMGRGWKKELRETMGEFAGDLRELREENARLREENARLRRGY